MSPPRAPTGTRGPGWLSVLLGPDGQALAIIGLVWLAFFGRLFVPIPGLRASFPPGDFVDQFYAFAVHETRELQAGRLPLWGPYAYAGHPFLADVQSAVFYPVSLVFTLIAAFAFGRYPLTWLTLEATLHFLLAGAFTYALGWRLFRHRGAALVTALTFTYGGYLTGYPPLQLAVLETDVWLPLLLLFLDKAIHDDGRRLRWAVAAGLTWGVAILAGHPQSAVYLSYVALAFALIRLWISDFGFRIAVFGTPPISNTPYAPRQRGVLSLAVVPLIALGLSAAQWLPSLEYTRLSVRTAMTYKELAGGFPYSDLVQFIVPAVVSLWSPLYIGILPLILAGLALARRPHRLAWFWGALAGVALLLSLGDGTPVYRLFYLVVPGFNLFRSQERAAYVVSFALTMLAGYGWLAIEGRRPPPQPPPASRRTGSPYEGEGIRPAIRGLRPVWLVWAGALLLAGLAVVLWLRNAGSPWVPRLAMAALFAALAGLWLWRAPSWSPKRRLAAAVLLIAADLFVANAHVNLVRPFTLNEVYRAAIVEPMLQDRSFFRARNEWRLPNNYGFLYQIEETWGASPLRLKSYDELWEALPEERRWQLLGVKYIITWHGEVPGQGTTVLVQVPKGEETTYLHRLSDPPPLAWLVRQVEVLPEADARLARLADPAFDPRRVAVLEEAPPLALAGEAPPSDKVRMVERVPGRMVLEVEVATDGLLVLSEIWYPGWRVRIDGMPATLLRADHALMAVPVPAGHHRVELHFDPMSVKLGVAVTGLTLLVAGALLVVSTRPGVA